MESNLNKMAKRIVTNIGNVFCVDIDGKYKCYFQYICNDISMLNSSVIRVFKTRYPLDYKPILMEIITGEVSFYAHTILRAGIQFNIWKKVGNATLVNADNIKKVLFGFTKDHLYIGNETISVDPLLNWTIWHVNENLIEIGKLPEKYYDSTDLEYGVVIPYHEIVNRIKLGYYSQTNEIWDIIKRIPHPDVDSYVRRDVEDTVLYQHFLGENVVQEIIVKENGEIELSEGNPLERPKFWETNWCHKEFITEAEFDEAWEKYSRQ